MKSIFILSFLILAISCSIMNNKCKSPSGIPQGTYNATFDTNIVKNHSINITFTNPNHIGWDQCNAYGCQYTAQSCSFKLGNCFSTKMACLGIQGVFEKAVLQSLQQIISYKVLGNGKIVLSNGGNKIVLSKIQS